jgi:hypothetical protein
MGDEIKERIIMAIKDKEIYKGKTIKQVKGITKVFDSFFKKEKFKNIIEIGTGNGAFSIYFATKAKQMNALFTTIDIKNFNVNTKQDLLNLNANVIKCDINKNTYIEEILKEKDRCLILNDGGGKVPEFNRFCKKIKSNDVLMTHDFYVDRKTSASGIIVMNDVELLIEKNGLNIIYSNLFDNFLWLCVTKMGEK